MNEESHEYNILTKGRANDYPQFPVKSTATDMM